MSTQRHCGWPWGIAVSVATLAVACPTAQASVITLDRCVVTVAGARLVVSGTIGTGAIDLVARTGSFTLGALALRDVVATVTGRGHGLRACATAHLGETAVSACGSVPSLAALEKLARLEVTWHATSPSWAGDGTAVVVRRPGGEVRLEHGRATLKVPARTTGPVSFAAAQLVAELAGGASAGDLVVTGKASTDRLTFGETARLDDVAIPFVLAVHVAGGATRVELRDPIVVAASRAAITVVGSTVELRGSDVALSIDPFAGGFGEPLELAVHARGIPLGPVLAAFGRGRVAGSGFVDGSAAVRIAASGVQLTDATFRGRGPGAIQLNDAGWRDAAAAAAGGLKVQQRVVAALGDFEYASLAVALAPPGARPELSIALEGHGKRVQQTLVLAVNVQGVRDAMQLALRADR